MQVRSIPARYGLAVGLTFLALLLTRFLPFLSTQGMFVLPLAAIFCTAWYGGRLPAIIATLLSTLAIDYLFVLPVNSFLIHPLQNAVGLIAFIAVALLFIEFVESYRRDERTLQEKARLLDLTHDTVFVRDMNDVITYWNRGAEELYGWARNEAIGWVSHELTKTIFPGPLQKINEELLHTGRWEGELVHTKRDGTQVVVASRWALQRDQRGVPVAVLETNNDISERKRAEEALQRLTAVRADVSAAFAKPGTLRELLLGCVEAIVRHVDAAFARIWTLNKDENMLELQASAGIYTRLDGAYSRIHFGDLKVGWIAKERKPHLTNDVLNDLRVSNKDWARACGFVSFAGYPLIVEERVVGVMALFARHALSNATLDTLASVADAIAQGIERKKAEEKLRRSQASLLDAQQLSRTGSWTHDLSSGAVTISPETTRIWGIERGDDATVTDVFFARMHPEDRLTVEEAYREALVKKSGFESEFRIVLPDGTIKNIHSIGHPIVSESGDIVEFVGAVMDLTERKRAEALLAGENSILEMVAQGDSLAQMLDALCRLVEDQAPGVLASVLLLERNLLRHGGAPSLPKPYTDAIDGAAIGPSAGSCGTAAYRGAQVIVADIETDPLWANYRDLALPHSLRACWSTPIFSSQRKVIGTFAMYYREPRSPSPRDQDIIGQITQLAGVAIERKLTQEALRATETELAHMARVATLGELTASIAHEVNQPLGAIVNNAGASLRWLAAQNMDEVRQSIEHVIKDGHRASEIISRIRALVKKTPPQKDRLDLDNIVREVITLARAELDGHHVALQLHVSDDCSFVWGDRVQIQQVLLNLIMNAIEAMSAAEGSRTLRINAIPYEERHTLVTVQDSGPGLDPTQLNRLFEAFYSTKPGGLGMGLAISRSIIEAHDGRLWAETNEPCGALFQFTLPKLSDVVHTQRMS